MPCRWDVDSPLSQDTLQSRQKHLRQSTPLWWVFNMADKIAKGLVGGYQGSCCFYKLALLSLVPSAVSSQLLRSHLHLGSFQGRPHAFCVSLLVTSRRTPPRNLIFHLLLIPVPQADPSCHQVRVPREGPLWDEKSSFPSHLGNPGLVDDISSEPCLAYTIIPWDVTARLHPHLLRNERR